MPGDEDETGEKVKENKKLSVGCEKQHWVREKMTVRAEKKKFEARKKRKIRKINDKKTTIGTKHLKRNTTSRIPKTRKQKEEENNFCSEVHHNVGFKKLMEM